MSNQTNSASAAPIRISGHDIKVVLTADHFWMWERMAEIARDQISRAPAEAVKMLDMLSEQMGRAHAVARKDDPTLPGYYRRYLEV